MRLRIKNWGDYQQYKDRCPPWIKLHYRLLSSKDWVVASDCDRVLAIACMLIASQDDAKDGSFEADPEYIKRVAYLNKTPDFKPLIKSGFLEVLADDTECKHEQAKATTETETETETEESKTRKRESNALDFSSWPEQPSEQVLKDWLAHRKRSKAPASQTVIDRLAGKLADCVNHGYSVDDCLSESVTRGWRGLELEWLTNAGVKPSRKPQQAQASPQDGLRAEYQELHARIRANDGLGIETPSDVMARYQELVKLMRVR